MKDIINVFCKEFDNVALIAGSISEGGSPLNTSVRISRIIKYNKKSIWHRLISWIIGTIQTFILVNTTYKKCHLFFTSNPPTLAFLPLINRRKYSILIYDIYPDGLIAGKFLSQTSLLTRCWKSRNMRYFKQAMNIFTLTETMAKTLSCYVQLDQIKVISPWALFSNDAAVDQYENKFTKKHRLSNKFLVMYSGNIGLGHNVESLMEVARILNDRLDILFIIIGEGWNKKLVEKKASEYGLINCVILPFQDSEMFRHSLSAADLGVVSIPSEGANVCAPSKTYNLLSLNIPLLCITEGHTELAKLVNTFGIGRTFRKNQYIEMANYILTLVNDKAFYAEIKECTKICSDNFTIKNAEEYLIEFKSKIKNYGT